MNTQAKLTFPQMVDKVDLPEVLMTLGLGAIAALAVFIALSSLTSLPSPFATAVGLVVAGLMSYRTLVYIAHLPPPKPLSAQQAAAEAPMTRTQRAFVVVMGTMVALVVSLVLSMIVGEEQYRDSGQAALAQIVMQVPDPQGQALARQLGAGAQHCFEMGYRQVGIAAAYGAWIPGPGHIQVLAQSQMKQCYRQQVQLMRRASSAGSLDALEASAR